MSLPLQVDAEIHRRIAAAYVEEEKTILEIAEEYGYATSTIRKYLVRAAVALRSAVPRPGRHWAAVRKAQRRR